MFQYHPTSTDKPLVGIRITPNLKDLFDVNVLITQGWHYDPSTQFIGVTYYDYDNIVKLQWMLFSREPEENEERTLKVYDGKNFFYY